MPNYIDKEKLIRDLIDNRGFYPAIVKNAIENAPTEDVVPRAEVEKARQVGFELGKTDNIYGHSVEKMAKKVEKLSIELEAMRGAAKSYKMHYDNAKQEVAKEILGHLSSHTSIGIRHLKELMAECDNEENKIWLEGKISELCNLEKIISELRKKYIGE